VIHPTTATTATSARAARPGQKEDRTMTAATATALPLPEDFDAQVEARITRSEPRWYADRISEVERGQNGLLRTSLDAILDQVARNPDGTLDLERLGRLVVAGLLVLERHRSAHANGLL
jgi:hypothetical protein